MTRETDTGGDAVEPEGASTTSRDQEQDKTENVKSVSELSPALTLSSTGEGVKEQGEEGGGGGDCDPPSSETNAMTVELEAQHRLSSLSGSADLAVVESQGKTTQKRAEKPGGEGDEEMRDPKIPKTETGAGNDAMSARGRKALSPFSPYILAVNAAKADPWSEDNPDGHFMMGSAESILTFDLIHEKIKSCREIPQSIGLYGNFRGGLRLRTALSKMMERTFMGVQVNPDHICVSSGVTAVLDLFFFATCDAGDACFIPAPYFPAFDNDMGVRNDVIPVPIQPRDKASYIPALEEMNSAYNEAKNRGLRPRVLLLTNPGNPLGTLYPESVLRELLVWACNLGLHVLSDEIYANSKFGPSDDEFVSLEKVAQHAVAQGLLREEIVNERVHTAYGMSKDFGMNGFRVGCLHSKNSDILKFWQNMGMFAAVSNDTQHALSLMLEDDDFVDTYVSENKRRLRHSYELLTSAFESGGMPYMPACAAMFCWLDLRSILPEPTFEGERVLWQEILQQCKIVVTPGEACHYADPGFFRVCYAAMPPSHLQVACDRLKNFWKVKKQKLGN